MSSSLIKAILAEFENCKANGCLQTTKEVHFKVFDRKDNCCFICCIGDEPKTYSYFEVINTDKKELGFIAIDKCLIPTEAEESKKCDCAIFDDKTFYFIEIKTSTSATRRKRKAKAFEQLKDTISFFKTKIDFDGFDLYALICMGCKAVYPRTTASHMGRRMELSMKHQAKLVEGNLIEFN